jgi:hypothetical protein
MTSLTLIASRAAGFAPVDIAPTLWADGDSGIRGIPNARSGLSALGGRLTRV